jgi:hypothetical protein
MQTYSFQNIHTLLLRTFYLNCIVQGLVILQHLRDALLHSRLGAHKLAYRIPQSLYLCMYVCMNWMYEISFVGTSVFAFRSSSPVR